MTREDETKVTLTYEVGKMGEFHRLEDVEGILELRDQVGVRVPVTDSERRRAVKWGYLKIKKARRRRKQKVV